MKCSSSNKLQEVYQKETTNKLKMCSVVFQIVQRGFLPCFLPEETRRLKIILGREII